MGPEYYLQHIDFSAMAKPDFTTLFMQRDVFNNLVLDMSRPFRDVKIDKVACPESLGFIFGAAIAQKLKVGLVPVRKAGKLPTVRSHIVSQGFSDYTKQKSRFEMNKALIEPGDRVLLVDDWAETGGQIKGLVKLIEKRGATIVGISLLGFNEVKKTRSLDEKYKLHAIIRHTLEGERDLTKPIVV
ncbi:MAG TPA: phosphoribosyltransferase family protein [Pseudomonadales bacterium]|nr:phosphoribosyltransferase family protein [Pseudomonadales bacterium]